VVSGRAKYDTVRILTVCGDTATHSTSLDPAWKSDARRRPQTLTSRMLCSPTLAAHGDHWCGAASNTLPPPNTFRCALTHVQAKPVLACPGDRMSAKAIPFTRWD